MRRLLLAALLAAAPALAQPDAALLIGGERYAPADVVDARGLPDGDGGAVLMVTFTEPATRRLMERVGAGTPLEVSFEGRTLSPGLLPDTSGDGAIILSGFKTLDDATTLARRLSGKPPLRESLED